MPLFVQGILIRLIWQKLRARLSTSLFLLINFWVEQWPCFFVNDCPVTHITAHPYEERPIAFDHSAVHPARVSICESIVRVF